MRKRFSDAKAIEKEMTEITLRLGQTSGNTASANSAAGAEQIKWRIAAMLGFAGGFSFLVIGLFISLLGRFFESGLTAAEMSRVGTVLLVPAFPLMFFGAHALDKIYEEKRQRAVKRTAFKEVK